MRKVTVILRIATATQTIITSKKYILYIYDNDVTDDDNDDGEDIDHHTITNIEEEARHYHNTIIRRHRP